MTQTLTVHTPSHTYPIFIAASLDTILAEHVTPVLGYQNIIVTNNTVAALYLPLFQAALDQAGATSQVIILPDGECYKNHVSLMQIYDGLMAMQAERHAVIFALGGGVIGDMAGFAAATYRRGIDFVQVPTTLLSQVDSSVGGKTAINHPAGKNMIGAFYQPQAVFAAQDVLKTLPQRELSAGLAEVIKYAVLGDLSFFEWLEKNMDALLAMDTAALSHAVAHCCQMKAAIVAADEKESGQRALLNLGHTFGHAIEAHFGFGVWLHGEAVAAGMVAACRLAEKLLDFPAQDTERLRYLLQRANLPDTVPTINWNDWLQHMQQDKKVENGRIRFIIPTAIGNAVIQTCDDATALRYAIAA